ncbi:hypothetical protein [Vulcanisaeta souniana]|nr:hypothetical protein [Vulcanisaeta souniana]GGI70116.1 hypothetical protein GCM10007112_03890 [Vulcanisaeta souniana JCM 11219]
MAGEVERKMGNSNQNNGEGVGQRPNNPTTKPRAGGEEIPNKPPQAIDEETKKILEEVRSRVMSKLGEIDNVFNRVIEDLTRFKYHLVSLAEKYAENADNIKAFTETVEEIVQYVDRVKQWYKDKVYSEVIRLFKSFRDVEIRIRKKGITIRGRYVTISASKAGRTDGGITVKFIIKGIGSINVNALPLIPEPIRMSIQVGLMNTDGYIDKRGNRPCMKTSHLWQVILWLLAFPGKTTVRIELHVNKKEVKVAWTLRSLNYAFKMKPQPQDTLDPLLTIFAAILGDGTITKPRKLRVSFATSKETLWKELLEGWHKRSIRKLTVADVYTSYAVEVLKRIYHDVAIKSQILLDILSILAMLNDAEKIRRFFMGLETRFKKPKYSIILCGKKFTVILDGGYLRLECEIKPDEEARIIECLRAKGIVARAKGKRSRIVTVSSSEVRRMVKMDEKLRESITAVLCKRYYDTTDEKKRQAIRRYLMELAPIEGAAAAIY